MIMAAYGLILPQWVLDLPARELPEHPRLAAAALAPRGAHPSAIRSWRCRDRGGPSCRWTLAWTPAP